MQHARLAVNPRRAIEAALTGDAAGLAVRTSGSTGAPREVLVGSDAVVASARATTARLGGAGSWLLAIPPDRIGGALVVARAHLAHTELAQLRPGPFTPQAFAEAAAALPRGRRFTSLVPTQVVRLSRAGEGRAALASFDAVLVGGAPLPELGVDANLVSTYGATETCGGCVYDGVPLDGVLVDAGDGGRLRIAGVTLADGYADGDDAAFTVANGRRWFTTPDVGTWDGSTLAIAGRADDVIITGGLKAHPARIERALESLPFVEAAAVAGVPDPEWGARVCAWVVAASGTHTPAIGDVRASLAALLEAHELPRELRLVETVPRGPGGKIDRRAMRALARGEEQ